MSTQTLKVNIPKGYEIDLENSTSEEVVFKKELPKFWEDLEYISGYYVLSDSCIEEIEDTKSSSDNINVFPTKEEALASLALAQLCQLRDRYNNGWKPDWGNGEIKYCIYFVNNKIKTEAFREISSPLSFKTSALRDKFIENFKYLIEQAKPLL